MKKLMMGLILTVASSSAFARTGTGSVSCNTRDGDIVALYSWFHSQADNYSTVVVFVQDSDGNFKQYKGENEEALEAIAVKTAEGKTVVVTPDLKTGVCSIQEK